MKRIFIANRGEIALRIIRSVRELGLESVSVYSDADSESRHRTEADFCCRLKGSTSDETYLNIPKLLEAIKDSGADAVHPGYGFLSENAEFAAKVTELGVKFIGPDSETILELGDKVRAKKLMQSVDVPVVPGSDGALGSWQELRDFAHSIGYPLIIKAAAGGGGRGMRIVEDDSQLQTSYESCTREAKMYFGNPAVFCERYVKNPRHIEIQVLFDEHGNGIHLFERDCSIQRRHQKLIEEAPSQYLNDAQRKELGSIAVRAGQAASYKGVGTVEFICEAPDKAYFMEMNTRIQVEHPVTEMITGIDLIAEQIRAAKGEKLRFKQEDIKLHGWAFEARINAEDFKADFSPSIGRIKNFTPPGGPFVRIDTHIYNGYDIPTFYDSMIAKLIVWGESREAALTRMARALSEMQIDGIKTTALFHEALVRHPVFKSGDFTTGFIEKHMKDLLEDGSENKSEAIDAAIITALMASSCQSQPIISQKRDNMRQNWTDIARKEIQRDL